MANRFLSEGWRVGVYDLAETDLQHENLITGHLDASDPESWDAALADFTSHTGGRIDVLDNNAGVIRDGNLQDQSVQDIAVQVNVNALGVTYGARAAYPYLRDTPGAQLVNMASASAVFGQPEISVYGATKAYVGSLTEALSLEWRHDDIRVVDIWPLWAKTALAKVSAPSVSRLGVNITPESVAQRVWEATHPKNGWQRGRLHYGVSLPDEALYRARHASPDRLARVMTRLLAAR